MKPCICALALAAALALGSMPVAAQEFPDRPVKIINPFAAGGATDVIARAIAQRLSEMWKQPVIVESRRGPAPSSASTASRSRRPTVTRWSSPTARPSSSRRISTTSCATIRSGISRRWRCA